MFVSCEHPESTETLETGLDISADSAALVLQFSDLFGKGKTHKGKAGKDQNGVISPNWANKSKETAKVQRHNDKHSERH